MRMLTYPEAEHLPLYLQNLQRYLLHTFTGNIMNYGWILRFSCDLINLINR